MRRGRRGGNNTFDRARERMEERRERREQEAREAKEDQKLDETQAPESAEVGVEEAPEVAAATAPATTAMDSAPVQLDGQRELHGPVRPGETLGFPPDDEYTQEELNNMAIFELEPFEVVAEAGEPATRDVPIGPRHRLSHGFHPTREVYQDSFDEGGVLSKVFQAIANVFKDDDMAATAQKDMTAQEELETKVATLGTPGLN